MTAVDIADIDAALARVRTFITLLEQNHTAWEMATSSPTAESQMRQTDSGIQEQLPLIRQIASRVDAYLVDSLAKKSSAHSWSYNKARDIPIIPVRVQGAPMPSEDELPPSIAELTGFQSAEVTDCRWDYDLGLLIQAIDDLIALA